MQMNRKVWPIEISIVIKIIPPSQGNHFKTRKEALNLKEKKKILTHTPLTTEVMLKMKNSKNFQITSRASK